MKKFSIIFFVIIIALTACKKYPQGGFVNRGPKNIIGVWKLALYEVNGIDSTDLINYNGNEDYKVFNIQKNASTISILTKGGVGSISFVNENNNLSFSGDGKALDCTNFNNVNYCFRTYLIPESDGNSNSAVWKIEKLKSNEIKLSLTQKNSYKIIFNK